MKCQGNCKEHKEKICFVWSVEKCIQNAKEIVWNSMKSRWSAKKKFWNAGENVSNV